MSGTLLSDLDTSSSMNSSDGDLVQKILNDMNDGHEIYSTTFSSNSILSSSDSSSESLFVSDSSAILERQQGHLNPL